MRRKNTDIDRELIYPIIPIYLPYTDDSLETDANTTSSDDSEKSDASSLSTASSSALLPYILFGMETGRAINANLPEQTNEILEQLRDPATKIEIRRMKKTSYTYRNVPQKVSESISCNQPASLGTACGIGSYGLIRLYVIAEDYETANQCGFHRGDIILDGRTRTESQLAGRTKTHTVDEDDTQGAIGFILPVDSHCVPETMARALSDFIQISLLPLSVAVPRQVSSNHGGGLEASPKWRGVVVTDEVRDALAESSGWIYSAMKEKWGVSLAVENTPFCPEVVGNLGMSLISRISW